MNSTPKNPPEFIYKIIPNALWDRAEKEGVVPPMPIDEADGYMHFSTADQLRETMSLHFKGQGDLIVLTVLLAPISQNITWEQSRGGALFPHLYAPLLLTAIVANDVASVDENGVVTLTDTI